MKYRNLFTASIAGSFLLVAAAANAALDASITIKGSKQGQFKGTSTKHQGASDVIKLVSGFSFSIASPRDAASGLATGKRQHKPIVITRQVDAASPQIFQALSNGELLPAVRITVYKVTNGHEAVDYTIDLTNAVISADTRVSGKLGTESEGKTTSSLEEISFTYQKITISWASTGKSASDDW